MLSNSHILSSSFLRCAARTWFRLKDALGKESTVLSSTHLRPSPTCSCCFTAFQSLWESWGRWEGSRSGLGKYSKQRSWLGLANVNRGLFSHGPIPPAVPVHGVLSPGIAEKF